jgi:carbamoyl-phosphate synthase large subunit
MTKLSRINVLVTAVGGGGVGEQIIKSLRLSKNDYYIMGVDMQKFSKGLYEVDKAMVVPPANHADYIDVLLDFCIKESVRVLFCGSEAEIKRISPERDRFLQNGIFFPYNEQHILNLCFNKLETIKWLENNHFSFPKTILISSLEEFKYVDDFPVVIKPHLVSGGSTNVFIVQDERELKTFGGYLFGIYGSFISQQYIGTQNDEYTVGVLMNMNGEIINSIAVKKNIMSGLSNKTKVLNRTGKKALGEYLAISSGVSQGEIGRFSNITKQCENIALKMNCVSAINIQCRVVDDLVYVFEINPRFSGTISLRAMVGYNEPDILINEQLFNIKSELYFTYKTGMIMRGLSELFIDGSDIRTTNYPPPPPPNHRIKSYKIVVLFFMVRNSHHG